MAAVDRSGARPERSRRAPLRARRAPAEDAAAPPDDPKTEAPAGVPLPDAPPEDLKDASDPPVARAAAPAEATRPGLADGDDHRPRGRDGRILTPADWAVPGPCPEVTPPPIISLRGVSKRFGSHQVLQDISFDVPKGRITAILGPSGTGKSVMLKNIIALLTPEEGEIWVDGEQSVGMKEKDLYRVRRKFGVLFQDGALFGSMNLYDNIAFPLREHTKRSEREIREVVLEKADLVGLLDHLKKTPGEVSGGMKKRAGLARALAMDPEIVMFDEPDSGLDPVRVAYLDELVLEVQEKTGATFFIITHNIPSVMRTAQYMGVLFRSGLVRFASKPEMLASDNRIIRQFLSGRSQGPIGMDEMAQEDVDVDAQDEDDAEDWKPLSV